MKVYYFIPIVLIIIAVLGWYLLKPTVRPMAVSSVFYNSNPQILQENINNYLQRSKNISLKGKIRMILVPHAAYVYSGQTAAQAYKLIEGQNIKRVILIGDSHHHTFPGAVIDTHDYWETPLGKVKVDKKFAEKLIGGEVKFNSAPHQDEHSLEVEIPFLQTVIKNKFSIVPILFGNQGEEKDLLTRIEKNLSPSDLVVISTDLSHYLPLAEEQKKDQNTLKMFLKNQIPDGENNYCAIDAVPLGMSLARDLNWQPQLVASSNSSVYNGDVNKVVGYGAIIWLNEEGLNKREQEELLNVAKKAVREYVVNNKKIEVRSSDSRLKEKKGVFVTLYKNGNLRGCIGNIIGSEELVKGVRDMAIAATHDSRFTPVTEKELPELKYEISVLSKPVKINDWHDINLGEDGVIVQQGNKSGVFLPQVAQETSWNLEEFLSHLCSDKAGLLFNCYQDKNTNIYTFTAQVFGD